MSNSNDVLEFGKCYHIYNKANGKERLFITKKDYYYFLKKMQRFLLPFVDIFAYCLIPNHFHLLVSIKNIDEVEDTIKNKIESDSFSLSKVFSNFFNSYTRSFNNTHNRKGKLFLTPFKKRLIADDNYLSYLICYINRNPIHHGLVDNYQDWDYSSYNVIISEKPTYLARNRVIAMFGSKKEFMTFHQLNKTKRGLYEFD